MADFNLEQYLSKGIKRIVKEAIKSTLKNPKESAFLIKYASAVQKSGKARASAKKNGEHIPPFLIASITKDCNLQCSGCYAQANKACSKPDLTASEWDRIFIEARELGIAMILLAGGEPFLRPDVIDKASKCKEILFPIFTNGTLLNEQHFSTLNTFRNLLPILSIEGDQVITDTRRGKGVYLKLMAAMQKLDDMGILFGASITVTKENLELVTGDEFVNKLYEKGCKIIFYIEYVPVEKENLALTERERVVLANKLIELRKKDIIFISFPGDEKAFGGCLAAGRGFFHIASNGAAEPCPFSPYSDTNLHDRPLKEALMSPLFTKLSSGNILLKEHDGGCALFKQEQIVKSLLPKD